MCRKAFHMFDKDGACFDACMHARYVARWVRRGALSVACTRSACTGSGTIDVKELRTALNALGQHPTDEELFVMISQVGCACMGRRAGHGLMDEWMDV